VFFIKRPLHTSKEWRMKQNRYAEQWVARTGVENNTLGFCTVKLRHIYIDLNRKKTFKVKKHNYYK